MSTPNDSLMSPPPGRLLVLMYHGLHESRTDRGRFDPRYSLQPGKFAAQMHYLSELGVAGWLPVTGEALVAPEAPAGRQMVLITFDDGDASNVEKALPMLQEAGLTAVFFITRNFVGQRGMISRAGIRKLADAGMVIGSHGLSHRFLNTLSPAALAIELSSSRDFLQQITGREVKLLSLPGGRGGPREIEAAHTAGYRSVFGSRPGNNVATPAGGLIDRVVITRRTNSQAFEQLVRWQGPAVWRQCARYRVLGLPRRLLGDRVYNRLRQLVVH
ncbi:polysaccharide deacetylase family protein [Wenzhouxiangella sp. AB-CW3]|uniref:polysaccharide deacetylase family protein n=1 Tax=Wenzhouxiangella sp. AB-CW3 TaxID=2771012 RepID=UPI00168C0350|nr:polysaccharide deacetylase family protein [Wenzhouxiangella sp. AB-CW3]QOC22026.1 polysaccharide deacetylase family protein [Wenzhouxiangella sp. AB-CW3]